MVGISIFGAGGRMGRAIAEAAAARDDVRIVERDADVFVDFTAPEALGSNLDAARAAGRPILVGTTGLSDEHRRLIDAAAVEIAVLEAANTSLGVNLLAHLVREAAARLGPDWDVEILEMHHRHKKDAPSGTALMLGRAVAEGRGIAPPEPLGDRSGARPEGTIGFASLRGGSVAGEHVAIFAGDGERLELGHRSESRAIFARGAIAAALWLVGKPPGRYAMADVLGL
ncbi:MAG TPA: 4-hydroxy-tetrahydrodipicolinate reductase [Allosphingosinicella sp.]|nr:4-hydroxy-tetrahydrodipicolinate reductase [Allosphingosinicella sp.]